MLRALALPRNLDTSSIQWTRTAGREGRNDSWGATYHSEIPGFNGESAMTGRVLLQLPPSPIQDRVLSLVDVRLDFEAMRHDPSSTIPRVTVAELVTYFSRAAWLATTILPVAAVEAPDSVPPTGAPRLELHVIGERPDAHGSRSFRTEQLVDLTRFGSTSRAHLGDLAIGITTPIDQPEKEVGQLVTRALVRMAHNFGFTDADEPTLQS